MQKKKLLIRTVSVILVLLLAAAMFVIGRGHTVYFDNKEITVDGKDYEPFYKVTVVKDDEKVAKLSANDRGMCDLMGQTLSIMIEITDNKGDEPHSHKVSMPVPYGIDGIVLNIPALMAGLPEEAYMSEFVPLAVTEDEDEEVVIDEFGITEDVMTSDE
ncbi:MAG: hypothetical protein K5886_08425 [Lachnospiraceae bacterium]|nr:hypothetical protein [Lachnospiraceae bacterium]